MLARRTGAINLMRKAFNMSIYFPEKNVVEVQLVATHDQLADVRPILYGLHTRLGPAHHLVALVANEEVTRELQHIRVPRRAMEVRLD